MYIANIRLYIYWKLFSYSILVYFNVYIKVSQYFKNIHLLFLFALCIYMCVCMINNIGTHKKRVLTTIHSERLWTISLIHSLRQNSFHFCFWYASFLPFCVCAWITKSIFQMNCFVYTQKVCVCVWLTFKPVVCFRLMIERLFDALIRFSDRFFVFVNVYWNKAKKRIFRHKHTHKQSGSRYISPLKVCCPILSIFRKNIFSFHLCLCWTFLMLLLLLFAYNSVGWTSIHSKE